MDRFIGRMLDGRYEILEIIGVGGMAVVYKAKCHRLNRYVALKVLKDEYAVDDDFRRRFYDESQAVAMLSHPNIVAVYDVSRTEGIEYIVMELIDGITLKDYLGRRGPLSIKEVTFFSIQIAKALEHAHSRGIIHRDIKPQNIMLLADGTVKVADFGIARHVSKQDTYNMGEAIGSVHYVSPEQAKGSHIDNRADIYSFGVVMYEMLTGRLPFEGDTPISIALQHINSIALPPSDFVSGIPGALEDITMKAMNPSLSKRYSSATDMLDDLESFRNDPSFRVVIPKDENIDPVAAANRAGMDHTRRLNNTGEVELHQQSRRQQNVEPQQGRRLQDPEPLPQKPRRARESEYEQPQKRKGSGFPASLIFSIIAVAVFFAGAIYFMISIIDPFGTAENNKLKVPNFVGLKYEEIMKEDKYAEYRNDFIIVQGESVYDDSIPAGTVKSQTPLGGHSADKGDRIELVTSRGPKKTILEDYAGVLGQQVITNLRNLGLVPVYENLDEFNEGVQKGFVIRTEPGKDAELTPGDTVVVIISKGKELGMVKTPDLTGLTLDEARTKLAEFNLVLGFADPVDSDKPAGTIVFQVQPVGQDIMEESTVDVHYSVGTAATEPPDSSTVPPSSVTTAPPASTPTGSGTRYIPEAYRTAGSDLRYYMYTVNLTNADGGISVQIYVNGYLEYEGTHYSSEGSISVELVGLSGLATVKVVQNGSETTSDITF